MSHQKITRIISCGAAISLLITAAFIIANQDGASAQSAPSGNSSAAIPQSVTTQNDGELYRVSDRPRSRKPTLAKPKELTEDQIIDLFGSLNAYEEEKAFMCPATIRISLDDN